ncbi:MAG: HupE/UreJ family protein [Minicystis sp.]
MERWRSAPRLWALVTLVFALLVTLAAEAHPARTSAVFLDIAERSVEAELQLPLDQLGLALEKPLDASPGSLVADLGPELGRYVSSHIGARARDDRAFAVEVRSAAMTKVDGADNLVVQVSLRPPEGAPASAFTLQYDVILHRVVSHKIFVSVRRDFKNAVFSEHPELLGVLRFQRDSLVVDRAHGSWWRGFGSVFALGMRHIAEGTDHLLFLLVLLLPSPLVAQKGRWGERDTGRRSVVKVLQIVTAFTVGHSLTLITGAAGVLRVRSQPVEVLIAISILVSAIHALRPVFKGKEPLVAAGFGLVHGLAFATTLADFGLDARALALGILGFNLGIEAMQLAVVVLTIPWLLLLSRSAVYTPVRVAGAAFGAVAACGWVAERALAVHNPVAGIVEAVFKLAPVVIAILAVSVTVVMRWRPRVAGAPAR